MTIQQMKYLMAIVYAGSISEAAKQLYVAQSSVSASMRELENEFGFEIFTRGSRGVSLTRKGENLAVDVKTISHVSPPHKGTTRMPFFFSSFVGKPLPER